MTHRIIVAAFFTIFLPLSLQADTIFIRGKDSVIGNITSEDAKNVVINAKVAKKTVPMTIPSSEIIDIHYDNGINPADLDFKGGAYREAKKAERDAEDGASPAIRKAALATAVAKYNETYKLMKKDSAAQKNAARHIQYKIALLTLQQALVDKGSTEKGIQLLSDFRNDKNNLNCWQINDLLPKLAQLQLDAKDYTGAAKAFQEMADLDVFSAEARRDAELMVVQVLVRGKKVEEANKKLDGLEKRAVVNPVFSARIKMARADILIGQKNNDKAMEIIRQVVKESTDKQIKAIAHNMLGESLYNDRKYNEALWEFLYVDTLFNADKHQHAKALYFLMQTFKALNNAEKAQQCEETLRNGPQFAGTEWQRLLPAVKSK